MSKIQRGKPVSEAEATRIGRHPLSQAADAKAIKDYIDDEVKTLKDVKEVLKLLAIRSLKK